MKRCRKQVKEVNDVKEESSKKLSKKMEIKVTDNNDDKSGDDDHDDYDSEEDDDENAVKLKPSHYPKRNVHGDFDGITSTLTLTGRLPVMIHSHSPSRSQSIWDHPTLVKMMDDNKMISLYVPNLSYEVGNEIGLGERGIVYKVSGHPILVVKVLQNRTTRYPSCVYRYRHEVTGKMVNNTPTVGYTLQQIVKILELVVQYNLSSIHGLVAIRGIAYLGYKYRGRGTYGLLVDYCEVGKTHETISDALSRSDDNNDDDDDDSTGLSITIKDSILSQFMRTTIGLFDIGDGHSPRVLDTNCGSNFLIEIKSGKLVCIDVDTLSRPHQDPSEDWTTFRERTINLLKNDFIRYCLH
jgi:hypothetical protein